MKSIGIFQLCPPAKFYLIISLIAIIVMAYFNFGTNTVFDFGLMQSIQSKQLVQSGNSTTPTEVTIKVLYVLFLTWITNIICRNTTEILAWILVGFQFVVFLGVMIVQNFFGP